MNTPVAIFKTLRPRQWVKNAFVLAPLEAIDAHGDPIEEIRNYIHRKMDMAERYPRESRLFANEILQGLVGLLNLTVDVTDNQDIRHR